MRYLCINVPDLNDSYSRVTLDGKQYLIRFTWNSTAERWSFGLYTLLYEPIAQGIKIVPRFPLNLQIVDDSFPGGMFGVVSELQAIRRKDFVENKAAFVYAPIAQEGL